VVVGKASIGNETHGNNYTVIKGRASENPPAERSCITVFFKSFGKYILQIFRWI
jgi:hypothetical protein